MSTVHKPFVCCPDCGEGVTYCGWCGDVWPCPTAQPRTFAPTVIPVDVQKVRTEAGVVWQRIPNSADLWDRADQPLTSRGWVTTGHLLASGTLTEVIEES